MSDDIFKGRGSKITPENPYLKRKEVVEHVEGLDTEKHTVRPVTKFYREHAKNGLSTNNSPDQPINFWTQDQQSTDQGLPRNS